MFYVFADGASIFNPLDDSLSIFSPKVTLELGKSGSFQFSIPPSNDYYNRLEQLKTSVIVELDNTEIFRGRVLSITKGFNNIKSVYCEGILSYLVDSVQKARRFNGKAATLYDDIIRRHNGMVESKKQFNRSLCTFGVENATVVIPGKKEEGDAYFGENKYEQAIIESLVDEWQTTYDYINTLFIDYLGGYLIAKYDQDTRSNYINYISSEEFDSRIDEAQRLNRVDHEIEFGVNMIDFQEEVNAEDMFTVLIPLGEGEEKVLTIEGATNKYSDSSIELVTIQGKQIGIADRAARAEYGSIVKTFSFDNVNEANTLFSDAVKYLKLHKNMPITYTIRAVDLHFINKTSSQIEIGDTVKITSPVHGVDRYLLCTKIEYDLANPANTSYTFGNPKQSLTERYKKNKDKDKKDSQNNDKRGAKGGGGAAGAAKDDAVDEAQGIVDKLYDAYIKVDDAAGTITMATLYHDIIDGKKHLKAMAGIDLDAGPDAAKVNIYTMFDDIGKAQTSIKQLSDALHAEIEIRSQYDTDLSNALNTFKQYANDTYATQEMLTQFKTQTSEALAGLRTYANDTFATIETFTSYKSDVANSFTSIKQWASDTFAAISISTEFDTKLSNTKTAIQSWCDGNFARIDIMATYRTKNGKGRTLAELESYADDLGGSLNGVASDTQTNTNSISKLNILATNLESVIKATTNYDSLKKDPKTGLINARNSGAGLTITSDELKGAINSDSTFAGYINGKLVSAKTSIAQTASDAEAKIDLIATFSGKSGKFTITSLKSGMTGQVTTIAKTVADKVIVDGVFNAKGNAIFDRYVQSNYGFLTPKKAASTFNGSVSALGGLGVDTNCTINCNLDVKSGYKIKIGKDEVALLSDLDSYVKTENYTTSKIRALFRGTSYLTVGAYIKSMIDAEYIKGIITDEYIKGIITDKYIKNKLGCENGLSDYISKHSAKAHTHTVTTAHTHKYKDKDGNYVNTQGASTYKFTTSSNS